jgi:plastocyanin
VRSFDIIALGLLLCTVGCVTAKAEPAIHTVIIENIRFSPARINVRDGDIVRFINKDLVPHTVTESISAKFDSSTIESGKEWQLNVAGHGVVKYYCRVHPNMVGEIVTEPANN